MRRYCAGAFALALIVLPAVINPAAAKAGRRPIVEVAFVLDTTGSMAGLIEGAKRKIWSIATAIVDANPDAEVRMALVPYRDIGDDYVTKTFDLTTDIQDLYAKLLEFRAGGGGDWPESVNEALHTGVTKLSWTQGRNIRRILFLVGDAPPHMDYAQDVKYPEVLRMARERNILVNAVQAGNARDTERVWRDIAQRGDGRYIPIPQDGGAVVVIETPYDTEIIELQNRINGTVIPYGPRSRRSSVEQKTRQSAAAPAPVASEMAGYMSKRAAQTSSMDAITGEGDLVADVTAGKQALKSVKDEDLPDDLRALEPVQRQSALDAKATARKDYTSRMRELVAKRDTFVREKRESEPKPKTDSFDRAVEETLRTQIKL